MEVPGPSNMSPAKKNSKRKKTGTGRETVSKKIRPNILERTSQEQIIAIRKKVHNFWFNREIPNLQRILAAVDNDENLPMYSQKSLYRLLKSMKFKYVVRKHCSAIIDRVDIICWRQQYIEKIQGLRSAGRPVYYLDETWVDAGVCKRSSWVDTSVTKRLIISHVGSAAGFVPGALLCFEAEKNTGDNHYEMNEDTFFEWFRTILPMLRDGAVIVMDNAPYHSMKKERYPSLSWKKDDIVTWLEGKGETVNPSRGKFLLLEEAKKYEQPENNYIIDNYAQEHGCTVLRIPFHHFELNPIELAWAKVKEYIRTRNTTYKLADVRQLVDAAIENVSAENWQNFIRHTIKEEERFFQLDHTVDSVLEESLEWANTSDDSDIGV